MTKQHFERIAQIIKEAMNKKNEGYLDAEMYPVYIAEHLADYFGKVNGSFNTGRFFEACGFTDTKKGELPYFHEEV